MKRTHVSTGNNLLYLFPVVILCYTFTLLWGWIPYTRSIITVFVGIVAAFAVSHSYFSNKTAGYLFVYALILILNVFSGDAFYNTFRDVFTPIIEMLLPALMVYGVLAKGNEKSLKIIVYTVLMMLIVNAFCSFLVDLVMPGSIRAIHGTIRATGDKTLAMTYYKMGLATYVMPHALPCIIPVLILGIKIIKDKFTKWLMVVSLVACLLLVYLSGSTTPVLTAMVAVVLGIFTSNKTGAKQLVTLGILFAIVYAIVSSKEIMLPLLRDLDDLLNNEGYFHKKILSFEELIAYGETSGDMEEREDLYMITWKAIISNSVIGVDYETGGHSTLLDCWGRLGIIGLIPFLLFIISQVKMSCQRISKNSRLYYYEGVFVAFIMLVLKNVAGWESWLFLFTVLPLLTIYVERMGIEKK